MGTPTMEHNRVLDGAMRFMRSVRRSPSVRQISLADVERVGAALVRAVRCGAEDAYPHSCPDGVCGCCCPLCVRVQAGEAAQSAIIMLCVTSARANSDLAGASAAGLHLPVPCDRRTTGFRMPALGDTL